MCLVASKHFQLDWIHIILIFFLRSSFLSFTSGEFSQGQLYVRVVKKSEKK